MANNRKKLGAFGEKVAEAYLKKKGYSIVETNFRCSVGEIDIVARKKDYLVFVEVRTRRSLGCGTPEESVTLAKREKLTELAQTYIQERNVLSPFWCIDVVAIEVDSSGKVTRIDHIENAVD